MPLETLLSSLSLVAGSLSFSNTQRVVSHKTMSKEKDSRFSDRTSTGHIIFLTRGFKNNPICPHHGKRAIICELPDELGCRRWYCIDCIAKAIYERRNEDV